MNRSVVSWALYDVANTAFNLGVVGLFLPLWINQRKGTTDADLGFPIAISMLVVLVISPFLGALTDQLGSRVRTLTVLNVAAVVATFFIGYSQNITIGLLFFSLAFISVYLAELLYNAMLVEASDSGNRGKVGGVAIAIGYIGSLAVIVLALQYQGVDTNYGVEFQVISGIFLLMSLPIAIFFLEPTKQSLENRSSLLSSTWAQLKRTREYFIEYPELTRFFIARYFYMISVTTGATFGVLYGIKTIGFTVNEVELVLLVGIIVSIPSAVSWGYVVDQIGPPRALKWNLLGWVVIFGLSVSIPWFNLDNRLWWPLGAMTGICFGGLWVADRPLLIQLSPINLGEMFGIYGTISRLAFLTGSFGWSFIAVTLELGQPPAVLSLLVCCVIGLVVLHRTQFTFNKTKM